MDALLAAVMTAQTHCQEESDDEGDADAVEASLEAEEELVGCAADAIVALMRALGLEPFAQAWQVCAEHLLWRACRMFQEQ
jgi:hypothetical protein